MRTRLLLAPLLLLASLAAPARELRVPLPERNDLVFDLPEGWKSQVRRVGDKEPPTIAITASDPRAFQLLVTANWPPKGAKPPAADEVRRIAQAAADKMKKRVTEPELTLKELMAPGKSGYYFFATFRQPEAGGFSRLTQGAMGFEELRITFTVFANEGSQGLAPRALDILRRLQR